MNENLLEKFQIQLELPLLIIRAPKGILACGYIDMVTCNKAGDVCAIVTGVNDLDELVSGRVQEVSKRAMELGIKEGDTGQMALDKMM
ncbi:MAG: DUF1805 domain-containing protein [Crocinitomicaceae bacterium]|nr:DUF1805 domain-containing protein [Crocinitomicaceae bacterium]